MEYFNTKNLKRYSGNIIVPFNDYETSKDIDDVDIENIIYKAIMENADECKIEVSDVEDVY